MVEGVISRPNGASWQVKGDNKLPPCVTGDPSGEGPCSLFLYLNGQSLQTNIDDPGLRGGYVVIDDFCTNCQMALYLRARSRGSSIQGQIQTP